MVLFIMALDSGEWSTTPTQPAAPVVPPVPAEPLTSAESTPHEALFYIEKNLRNEFPFVAGGEVIVDTELVGIRKDL